MSPSIIVLTEQMLDLDDAGRIVELHADDSPAYHILVPADTQGSLLAEVVDDLSMLEWRHAFDALRHHRDPKRPSPEQTLKSSLMAMRTTNVTVDGEVATEDPVAALEAAVQKFAADEVIVVTRPHAVEDTFHTDWASRAREHLGVPVLHIYAGSGWVGD